MSPRVVLVALGPIAALFGCGAAAPRRDPLAAETHFLGPYISLRDGRCGNGPVVLVRHATSNVVIDTLPPIREVRWDLTTCGETLSFELDCSPRPGVGVRCHAHEWPTPSGDDDWPLGLEAAAAIRNAPPCPPGRSCSERRDPEGCADDTVRAERFAAYDSGARWRVERCGVSRTMSVACPYGSPRTCVATTLTTQDAPPAGATGGVAGGAPASGDEQGPRTAR